MLIVIPAAVKKPAITGGIDSGAISLQINSFAIVGKGKAGAVGAICAAGRSAGADDNGAGIPVGGIK